MSYFPHNHEQQHENPEDVARPHVASAAEDEHVSVADLQATVDRLRQVPQRVMREQCQRMIADEKRLRALRDRLRALHDAVPTQVEGGDQ